MRKPCKPLKQGKIMLGVPATLGPPRQPAEIFVRQLRYWRPDLADER